MHSFVWYCMFWYSSSTFSIICLTKEVFLRVFTTAHYFPIHSYRYTYLCWEIAQFYIPPLRAVKQRRESSWGWSACYPGALNNTNSCWGRWGDFNILSLHSHCVYLQHFNVCSWDVRWGFRIFLQGWNCLLGTIRRSIALCGKWKWAYWFIQ